jgi:hypothetical protein
LRRSRLPEKRRRELEKDIANDLKQMPKEGRLSPVAKTFNKVKLLGQSRSGFRRPVIHGGPQVHHRQPNTRPFQPSGVYRPNVDFVPSPAPTPFSVTINGGFQGGQGGGYQGGTQVAAGNQDAGTTDSGQGSGDQMAAAPTDSGQTDAGQTDAGQTDAGQTDSGQTDAGQGDNQDAGNQAQ